MATDRGHNNRNPLSGEKQRQTISAEREGVGKDSNGRNVDGKHKRYASSKCELPLHQYPFGIEDMLEMLSTWTISNVLEGPTFNGTMSSSVHTVKSVL